MWTATGATELKHSAKRSKCNRDCIKRETNFTMQSLKALGDHSVTGAEMSSRNEQKQKTKGSLCSTQPLEIPTVENGSVECTDDERDGKDRACNQWIEEIISTYWDQ